MHNLHELGAWERLHKKVMWAQLGEYTDKKILDFGSGMCITADHYAKDNDVVAIEPWDEMVRDRWVDNEYKLIQGDINALKEMESDYYDVVLCHNVLEYIDDKGAVIKELARVLKPGGEMSIIKHNRAGRVMQMAVLLDDFDKANDLLDGKNSAASKFGEIRYYEDKDVISWEPQLKIEKILGIRTFWDLQQNQEKHSDDDWQEKMMNLDLRVSNIKEFRDIAFFHHIFLTK